MWLSLRGVFRQAIIVTEYYVQKMSYNSAGVSQQSSTRCKQTHTILLANYEVCRACVVSCFVISYCEVWHFYCENHTHEITEGERKRGITFSLCVGVDGRKKFYFFLHCCFLNNQQQTVVPAVRASAPSNWHRMGVLLFSTSQTKDLLLFYMQPAERGSDRWGGWWAETGNDITSICKTVCNHDQKW